MKICKLKLKNLNSFRGEQEIDFESGPLSDASLVAITGPTGAGKTTLLDAICVALYGKTPRLSGKASQHPRHLISHGEAEGFAEVYFEANNTRYHATWSVKRKGSPKAQLFDHAGGLITTKVAQEVESILGLDFGAFKRSVMLAQGEFAAFLKASSEERRTILEATAGVSIYEVLKHALNSKVSEVEVAYAKLKNEEDTIPEASPEQLAGVQKELGRLKKDTDALSEKSREIQQKKEQETKRKEDFEKLQSSEKRQEELLVQQPEIDALHAERENANRAERLRSEKQAFDTSKSELEGAEEALRVATTEKIGAEKQVKTDQAVFDEKSAAYQTASNEHDQKIPIYIAAKLDVVQATNRFGEAEKRNPSLANLSNQIGALENQLADRQTKQTELHGQIDDAQRFLEGNPLPADRQQRFTRTNGLLEQLRFQEKQLQTELTNKANAGKNVSSLQQEIKKLSDTHVQHLSEKAAAETTLEDANTRLNELLGTGTHEEWTARKQQASKAQPIAQKYEATQNGLADAENRLNTLNDTVVTSDAELERIETELATQTEVCQRAAAAVQDCETERESVLLADPINQLRQHLHTGEPCLVCGATEHPYTAVVEPESEERLQHAEETLAAAKTDAEAVQADLQTLKTKQIQKEQNKRNTADQIETCTAEIEALREDAAKLLTEWQAIYPDTDVSSAWTSEQFDIADTTIADITEANQIHTQASNTLQIVSQQLKACENDIKRETNDLKKTETQLKDLRNAIADLQADVAATETRFWESMPDTFHGVKPKEAVDQFDSKIKEVETCENERRNAETQLQVLNTNIEADQNSMENLIERCEALRVEIYGYLAEGQAFLHTVREKTGGLETEDKINEAIDALESDLQTKENARDASEQQLQNSRDLLTQKQTAHEIGEKQFNESVEKLSVSCQVYFDKLENAGFDSPEAHDNAFRDDNQIQDVTDRIDAHEDEMRELALTITELKVRFDESPFNPDALGCIETQLGEIETQLQKNLEDIGAQGVVIKGLKDALEKREVLAGKLHAAQQELERWQRLQRTIPQNTLRDFALEIMFKQMGSIANVQLSYLTAERYQLKVEGIGDLTVIDRWNANEERPVETLSGGESFLTSLALALALSELSSGRAQLNSLFLDEGFGTLDTETLDIAIAALEGLRMQGRSIFLISHIQELTRRLPVKINVRKQGNGSSSVDIRG